MSTTIFIEDSFDSAHSLPNVPADHKCHSKHGHTYRLRIGIEGDVGLDTGWIVDYMVIKRMWDEIKAVLDHKDLNDVLPNPTCELIAAWIAEELSARISAECPPKTALCLIEIRETERCGVVLYL